MSAAKAAVKLTVTPKPFALNFGRLALFGGVFGTGLYYKNLQASFSDKNKKLQYVQDQFENQQVHELNSVELRQFPWYLEQSLDQWEGKVVKLKGYLDEDRFFVRREKNGEAGFLVFAPFATSIDYLPNANQQANSRPVKNGIMVNLGWVPVDKKNEISLDPPVEAYEFTDKDYDSVNINMRKILFDKYEDDTPMYEITGVLKAGEKQNFWQRKVNWQTHGNYNWIDLPFMSRLFRFTNIEAASDAYIEFIADEIQDETYPIPSTRQTFNF